jgi:hypothetical protein
MRLPKTAPAPFWHSSSEGVDHCSWVDLNRILPCCLVHVIIMNKVQLFLTDNLENIIIASNRCRQCSNSENEHGGSATDSKLGSENESLNGELRTNQYVNLIAFLKRLAL